ncbi:beta-lactamase [Fibrisoma limi BUZ 3]|uniref:Beta-lactamase n=1 Tax=Fibrisoma limi BUZ 3 TaxID=1185876 RepID=I2GM74_9BACT|nr:serine hydrolase domain-containing protein [Fibrisoma limi]CCH55001.1 beta-lactamase [Fibrisoma limi BUZ 3]
MRFFLLLAVCLALPVGSQATPRPRKPINTLAELRDSIQKVMKREHIPGLMLVLATKDSVLIAEGLGLADIDRKTPVTDQHLFRMGSITKMFTTMGILKLVSQGKLKLDDPVSKIAPEVPIQNDWASTNPVRVVNLLEHTAGFDDMPFNKVYNHEATDPQGLAAVKVFEPALRCRWRPGERFSYSNPGYVVAGYLIEKLSGQPWHQFVTEQVMRPAGMTQSNLNLRPDQTGRYVQGYKWADGSFKKVPFLPIYGGSDGSLNASATDMARWIQFFLNDWQTQTGQWLPDSVLTEMETPHSTLAANAGLKAGYGLANYTGNLNGKYPYHGHNGGIDGFISVFGYNRELGVGYALSNNGSNPLASINKMVADFLTRQAPSPTLTAQPLDKQAVEPYLGQYRAGSPRNEILGFLERQLTGVSLRMDGDSLVLSRAFGNETRLIQTGPLTFRKANDNLPSIVLTVDAAGNRVISDQGNYFRHSSWLEAWGLRLLLLISFVFVGFSILAGIVWFIFTLQRSYAAPDAWLRLLPGLGALSLIAAVFALGNLVGNLTAGPDETLPATIIFAGTLVFAGCCVAAVYLLVRRWKFLQNGWLKAYLLVTILSSCYVAGLLFANGWIGIRF